MKSFQPRSAVARAALETVDKDVNVHVQVARLTYEHGHTLNIPGPGASFMESVIAASTVPPKSGEVPITHLRHLDLDVKDDSPKYGIYFLTPNPISFPEKTMKTMFSLKSGSARAALESIDAEEANQA